MPSEPKHRQDVQKQQLAKELEQREAKLVTKLLTRKAAPQLDPQKPDSAA